MSAACPPSPRRPLSLCLALLRAPFSAPAAGGKDEAWSETEREMLHDAYDHTDFDVLRRKLEELFNS